MKTIASVILVLFLVGFTAPIANASSPSASGTYRFVLDDDFKKSVEFSATSDERGTTTGQMTFRDEAILEQQDLDGAGGESEDPKQEFFMTASLDSMKIENNRAVLGGTVTDSSHRSYVGKWVQLVVEDNGDGQEVSDKLSWCFCQPEEGGWVPSDAEVKEDEGAWYKWWATDAEVKDDAGIQSKNIIPGNKKSCETFPLAAYEFAEIKSGEGQIQVQP
ncbi:MAG TPA: hypothetical protein VNO50_06575 [Pyrinomonadaceae bacterium]|nr:hypothetical protein [Pyrinomonadaceae bacterium]